MSDTHPALWNGIAELFRTGGNSTSRHAQDNELIAVPHVLHLSGLIGPPARRVLDYGCGAGGFCRLLHKLGHDVTGIDSSIGMIDIARSTDDTPGRYLYGSAHDLPCSAKFDVITAIMVFQFVQNIGELAMQLAKRQPSEGSLFLAVHNPAYVESCLHINYPLFREFHDGVPGFGKIILAGTSIPIYIRDASNYDALIETGNYTRVGEPVYPPFTSEFLRLFPETPIADTPKYCILHYRRR